MSSRLIKNIGSGLVAQAWMGILGLIALPLFARDLGPERYGLLALNLAFINFAGMADLGVGRAATKYLAEDYERNETHRTQRFVGTAMTLTVVLGFIGTAVLLLLTPLLVRFTFRIPQVLQRESQLAFWITGLGLMGVLLRVLFDGVLAGHHLIAILNLGNVIASSLRVGLSIAAILCGYSLLSVLAVNVAVFYLHGACLWWYTRVHFHGHIRISFGWDFSTARQLLALGSAATLSALVATVIFLYTDRFVIATFLPLALTGYYTMAFDIASRQAYASNSVAASFFPVFSGCSVTSTEDLKRSYLQGTKAVAVGTTGLAMVLIVFGDLLLRYWVNPDFAIHSSSSLSVLAIACLLSCYTQIPYTMIVAASARPAVCIAVFSSAVIVHLALSIVLLRFWSIAGVAAAFLVSYLLVFCYLCLWISRNLIRISVWSLLRKSFLGAWLSALFVGTILRFAVAPAVHNLFAVLSASAIGYVLYLCCCLVTAYTSSERYYVRELLRTQLQTRWRKSWAFLNGEP